MTSPRASTASVDRRLALFGALGYLYLGALVAVLLFTVGFAVARGWWVLVGFPAGILLAVAGAVLGAVPAPAGVVVRREQAPRLFRAVDRVRGALRAPPVDFVVLTPELNASVLERPAFGLVGPARRWLSLGLPLLHALPREEVEAIVAHELAHLARGDTRSTRWVKRVAIGWESLVTSLQAGRSWIGPVFVPFLRWYLPRLETLLAHGSRAAELEADRLAARVAGADTTARALVRFAVRQHQAEKALYPAILRGSRDEDAPPDDAFERLLRGLRGPLSGAAPGDRLPLLLRARALDEHSHPCLRDRTEALGTGGDAAAWAARLAAHDGPAAADELLEPEPALTQAVGEGWTPLVGEAWAECRMHARTVDAAGEDDAEAAGWARACWSALCEPAAVSVPLLRGFLADHPHRDDARLELGLLLTAHGGEEEAAEGAALLERVAALESTAALRAAEALQEHYARTGAPREVRRCRLRVLALREAVLRGLRERSGIAVGDTLRPFRPGEAGLAALAAALEAHPTVDRAYLVEKRTRTLTASPMVVLAVELAVPWFRPASGGATEALVRELVPLVPAPPSADRLVLALESGGLRRRLRRLPGAEVYRRGEPLPAASAGGWSTPTLQDHVRPGVLYAAGGMLAVAIGLAVLMSTARDPAPSLAGLRADASEHPNDARALERLGRALAAREAWAGADSAFAAAVEADSTSAYAFSMLGWVRLRDGRCEEAVGPLRRALLLDTDDLASDHSLYACLLEMGEWEQAEMGLRDLAARAPGDSYVQADHGRALAALMRDEEAEAAYKRALRLEPGQFRARYGIALLHIRRGDLAGAEARLRILAGEQPSAYLWAEIGQVAHLAGDYPGSAEAFAEADRIDPAYFSQDEYRKGMWDASREGRMYTYPD